MANKLQGTQSETDEFVCDIEHPVFNIIDNSTRRKILRLIACESNYGNRIANMLNISSPTVHRHLKFLLGEKEDTFPIIKEVERTKDSYSGKKGGEAFVYEIDTNLGIFMGIFPNFVHSQIFQVDKQGKQTTISKPVEDRASYVNLKGLKPNFSELKTKKQEKFNELYDKIQKYNLDIIDKQRALMDTYMEKNELMGELDELMMSTEEVDQEKRLLLRAITCLGPECSSDLSHFLHMDDYLVFKHVEELRKIGWLAERVI